MPYYFPSFSHNQSDSSLVLNDPITLQGVGQRFGTSAAAYAIDQLIGLGETSVLGPVGIIADIVQTVLFLVELFSAPTKIDIQKEVVERWSEPLFRFAMLNYCLPQVGQVFQDLSSDEVQDAFRQRPDVAAFAATAYSQADCIVNADLGLQGYGGGINQRLVNQWCGNAVKHGWTVQQLIDTWQGVVSAAGCGPTANGPPPPDGPVALAIAGLQVGALLYHKWSDGQVLSDADWAFFSDYYVQTGFNMEADSPDTGVYWYTTWATHLQGNDPPMGQPATLYSPAWGSFFSPPCMGGGPQSQAPSPSPQPSPQPSPEPQPQPTPEPQPQPPVEYVPPPPQGEGPYYIPGPQPQPQPPGQQPGQQPGQEPQPPQGPTPYQRACQILLALRAGENLTQEQIDFLADPANYGALSEALCDPECGYVPVDCPQQPSPIPQPQPEPIPQPQPCAEPCPPGQSDGLCDPDCQQQIDRLQDTLDGLPLEKLAELPDWERWMEQRLYDCCDNVVEIPPQQPPPDPNACPPGCQDQITNLQQVVNNWPQQVIQYVNNWYIENVQPKIDQCCELTKKCRQLFTVPLYTFPCATPQEQTADEIECGVQRYEIDWCCFGQALWGKMAECWLDANTPADEDYEYDSEISDPNLLMQLITSVYDEDGDERLKSIFADTLLYLGAATNEDETYEPLEPDDETDPFDYIFEPVGQGA